MKMPPASVENQNSALLSTEENLQVFKLLGNRCQTIATTVVQLFLTAPPNHSQWIKKETGVLCYVKDNSKKNYFFRLFNLRQNQMVWEHEMYSNMEYIESTAWFHMFEGEDCIVAFNFANQQEALQLKAAVDQKLSALRRKEEKKARQVNQTPSIKLPPKTLDSIVKQELRLEKRKRNITKADISTPMDFVHISHVGWNPNTGFDVDIADEQLKSLFDTAGVSKKQLQDKDTREFIYDFISKHRKSALDADANPPVVPPRGPTRPTSANPRPAPPPPPVPNRQDNAPRKPRPPSPPKFAKGGAAPPPPPPPPPMVENVPPPPPMMVSSLQPQSPPALDGNAALLQSIRDGATLKVRVLVLYWTFLHGNILQPVEERKSSPVDDARGDLLSAIRKGIQLKPVDEREIKPAQDPSPNSTGGIDLARALKQALLERSKLIHSEDDDDDTSSTSNDDDWDD
ncbi:hypothetical protein HUJ05_005376 [Dendroctonus ponderosae]|nr:hypothetical protein HUJ05_005376 [Dendroctonus ponderosae]